MMIKKVVLLLLCIQFSFLAKSQEFIPLWQNGKKPNYNGKKVTDSLFNERIWRVATPGIYAFLVPKAENTGTSVLIVPGGGYERLSYLYNGFNFAKWYNGLGINVFVLIHRLPHQADLVNKQIGPVQDAQRAMKLIRSKAAAWNILPDKIGVMGISAGGHVASTLSTHVKDESLVNDTLDKYSCRPDFMVLLSPVITMGKLAHAGSKKNFLGADTTAVNVELFSNELQVTSFTAPTFMVHALNDSTVKVQNSLMFYEALISKKVNASIHIFPQGGHGIRLDENPGSTDLWMNLLELWLKEMKLVTPVTFK